MRARPLSNIEKAPTSEWLRSVGTSVAYMLFMSAVFGLLLFGPTIDQSMRKEQPLHYLLTSAKDFVSEAIMNYQCLGHRLWLFLSLIVLPSLMNYVKVLSN